MNKKITQASLINSEGYTFPEYANLGMGVMQLIILLFYGFLKLKKSVATNEARLQSMKNRSSRITAL